MPTGLQNTDEREKVERSIRGRKTQRLRIASGDIARVRFLTDANEVYWAYFHSVKSMTRLGKTYSRWVYCDKTADPDADCEKCKKVDLESSEVSFPRFRMFFWVFLKNIQHIKKDDKELWKAIKRLGKSGKTFYEEEVNLPLVLETGPGNQGYIEERIKTWADKYGTLCDRDYEWSRKGEKMEDTVYDLIPMDSEEFELSEELKDSLIPLENVARPELVSEKTTTTEKQVVEDEDLGEEIAKIFGE